MKFKLFIRLEIAKLNGNFSFKSPMPVICPADRGIKHDFPFINICKVPREVLKTEGEARGFQPSRGTLQMLMNDKIMFDCYYCINSTKHCENEENIGASVGNQKGKSLSIIGKLLPIDYRLIIENPSIA